MNIKLQAEDILLNLIFFHLISFYNIILDNPNIQHHEKK